MNQEVREAMKKLKNKKSPGCDGIPAELWKATGESGIRLMHRICNMIWRNRQWPTVDQTGTDANTKVRGLTKLQ